MQATPALRDFVYHDVPICVSRWGELAGTETAGFLERHYDLSKQNLQEVDSFKETGNQKEREPILQTCIPISGWDLATTTCVPTERRRNCGLDRE
jgi:hypothetical protein